MKPLLRTPDQIGLRYDDVQLSSRDGTQLHAWWLPASKDPSATILFIHGNAENISTHIASVMWLPAEGVNVLLLDYRGYGQSGGVPTIAGAIEDVQAGLDYLAASSVPVIVLGQSLGASLSGVAVGAENPCTREQRWPNLTAVVLDAGFSRYSKIAKEVAAGNWLTYLFQWPAAWAMPSGMDLEDAIENISPLPVFIIHGKNDEVVPVSHAEALMRAAREPKQLLEYEGGHIQTFGLEENRQQLMAFIKSAHLPPVSICQ
ncbi:alpha/beta hydrolase [Spongiibacter sp. KMU-158]|uniref:Alpha/beta hydrolase n=1 Tax=Spongiibacter pelagi TaxID=2760804 RepID=A0A927C5H2_9GAMM|nr:alpha/beta hydrolase [Spongiibacter pelagi]MBD2860121.1 alpha/beta hydrolase [Spongiibacter pelagi]